jgi:hypothetical protein
MKQLFYRKLGFWTFLTQTLDPGQYLSFKALPSGSEAATD